MFADSYALLAALDGSPAYRRYFVDGRVVTTALNVVELGYALVRRGHEERLDELIDPFLALIVEPDPVVVANAARFKEARREAGARCSYVDAWGYATAQWLDLPFLTGDEDFRGVPGVTFLKA